MKIRLHQCPYWKPFLSLVFFIFFSIAYLTALGQTLITDSIQNSLAQYRQQNLQEKLYVHTDKNTYVAGETIGFKIYYIDAYLHKPLDISKVAYIELLDSDGKPLVQDKIALQKGNGTGTIQLPFALNTGNYILTAYTSWMKNFDPQFFFRQTIPVINTLKQPDWKNIEKGLAFGFQLFPEGGHLVQGLESKIAFRITDSTGKGLQAKGAIVNEQEDTVVQFQTYRFGLGHFLLKPHEGQQYKAVILLENGRKLLKDLPIVNQQGLVMKVVDHNPKDLEIHVSTQNFTDSIYLVSHCRQVITFSASGFVNNNKAVFLIPKSKLGDGINHFTIFNGFMQPLCERLFFKPPENTLSIQASTLEQNYQRREKATVTLTTLNKQAVPVSVPLSASVHLMDSISHGLENNILTYLFLTSELKGSVENPSYYFSDSNSDVSEAADNLMMVNGWTRFNWKSLFTKPKPFAFLPEYEGHIINATIFHKFSNKAIGHVPVYLALFNDQSNLSYAKSDNEGSLSFVTRNFHGLQNIFFQSNEFHDSLYSVQIHTPFSENHFINKVPLLSLSKKNGSQISLYNKSVQIQHNYYYNQPKPVLNNINKDRSAFFENPDKTYWLDDYTRFTTIEEILREYVSEVRVKKRDHSFELSILNQPYLTHFEANPLVLLNGVPIFDINEIMKLNPLKIEKIEVIAKKYFLGASTFHGIVSFSSYKDSFQRTELPYSASIIDYEGLQIGKDFFQPIYDYQTQKDSRLPDFRNVLTWIPNLQTSKEGNLILSFYTSDLLGDYVMIIQGITPEGQPGFTLLKIKVMD